MPIFRVLASRTELYLIEAFIQAEDRDEAEERFYGVAEGEEQALNWAQDFDSSETEIDSIEPLSPDHAAVPAEDHAHCLYCGRPVRWTGTPAGQSPTGVTNPGPWVHTV
jgi:hypothetical protein